jgi:hypothetical protein
MFSLWGSVVINFIIYDITKRKSSKIELFLLINIVSGISFITFLDAYLYFKAPSILLLTGFTLLFALFIAKKGYSKEHYNNPEYKIFFTLLIYYTAFYIFTISIYQTQIKILTFSLINSLLFLSFLIILKNKIHIINNSLTFTYRVIQLGLILYFITLFDQFRQINIYSKISFLESFIILVIFFILLHKNYGFYNLAEKNYNDFKRKLDIIVFNVFIFAFYSLFIIYFIDYDLGISLTIAIIIHGIWTIFTSLNNDFKFLSKLSIFLFILGLAKLFFIDLSNSSLVNKMIVFLVLGVILLLSAFSFQKIKNKLLNKE